MSYPLLWLAGRVHPFSFFLITRESVPVKCMKIKCLNFLTLMGMTLIMVVFSTLTLVKEPSLFILIPIFIPWCSCPLPSWRSTIIFCCFCSNPRGKRERVKPVRSVHRSIPLLNPIFEKLLNSACSTLSLPQIHDRLSRNSLLSAIMDNCRYTSIVLTISFNILSHLSRRYGY